MESVATQPEPSTDTEAPRSARPPLFVPAGALLLYFLRFGYDYGTSDQDEIIPYLLHRMDPSLFTQDWFVTAQAADFNVRTYFVWLLQGFSFFIPVWLAALLLHVASWLLVAGAVFALARHFTGDRVAASAAVVLALVVTPLWTLGGNELVHSMLVPSTLSWGLALWGVYHFLHARYILTPVLLGVACWFQALVGLQVAGLLIVIRLVNMIRREHGPYTVGSFAMFAGLFVLWSSPALGPLLHQQLTAVPDTSADAPSVFYILAQFRVPHHYLFFSFSPYGIVRFGALLLVGTALLVWPRFRARLHDAVFIVRTLTIIAILCTLAFVFTELVPVLFVAKLQLFKMTVLAKLLLVVVVSGALAHALPGVVRRPLDGMLAHRRWSLVVVLAAWALVIAWTVRDDGGFFHGRVGPWVRAETPPGAVEAWAQRNTSHAAIFAVPPSVSSFRTAAERTIVVNFKAIPYDDHRLVVWFERLMAMAPVTLPERGGAGLMDDLDRAYYEQSAVDLQRLSQRFGFDYVVRAAPLEAPEGRFREVFRRDGWYVYEIVRPTEPAE